MRKAATRLDSVETWISAIMFNRNVRRLRIPLSQVQEMRPPVRKKKDFTSLLDFAWLSIYEVYRGSYKTITHLRKRDGNGEGVGTQKRYGSPPINIERRSEQ